MERGHVRLSHVYPFGYSNVYPEFNNGRPGVGLVVGVTSAVALAPLPAPEVPPLVPLPVPLPLVPPFPEPLSDVFVHVRWIFAGGGRWWCISRLGAAFSFGS